MNMIKFSDIIVNGNISVDKIFKPLMKKTPTDQGTAMKYIEYIRLDSILIALRS